jgi:predicted nuclease of restriction endonuclease-like RecB superfamily
VIALVYEEPHVPRSYDAEDLPWIERLLDVVAGSVGQPWRVLVDCVERAGLGVHGSHRAAMLQALRRVLGGADPRGAGAGDTLLWIDLAMERPVALPAGRPAAITLAAFANLARIQRCVRRAHEVRLRVWDRANELVRIVAHHGVIAQLQRDGEATQLEIVGPLALLHSTLGYGRALAAIMPVLADHARFELDARCWLYGEETEVRITTPIVLPPAPELLRRPPGIAERLARDLDELGYVVEREPPPLASGPHLVFPDLALTLDGTRRFVEVLGFSTPQTLNAKLAHYAQAGARVVLCVDLATAPGCDLRARICGFTRHVEVDDLLATLRTS